MIQTVFEAFRGAERCFKGISPPDRGSRFVSGSQSEKVLDTKQAFAASKQNSHRRLTIGIFERDLSSVSAPPTSASGNHPTGSYQSHQK